MKLSIISIFAVVAVAQASVDWDNLIHGDLNPMVNGQPIFPKVLGNGRIVGGDEVAPHSRPFQAALFISWGNGQQVFCGGSLISPSVVLTAAHCVTAPSGVKSVEVLLGAHNIRTEEDSQVRITSTEFVVHSGWNQLILSNDIALIKLPEPVKLNENIAVVALPSRSDVGNKFTDDVATVSGWGKDSDKAETVSPVLRQTSNPVISKLKCSLRFPFVIKNTHVCVSGSGGHSSCNGDSGGPLTVVRDGEVIQIGLVSFGNGLGCSVGFPHVYTRLTEYLDWIQENSGVDIN